jgi:plasmid stabilization system protein ParE
MTTPLIRSPESARDVENIVNWYIGQKSPHVGVRFAQAVDETLEFLAMFPEIGSPYESSTDTHKGVRIEIVHGFPRHVILYRLTKPGLYVMRVFHGHQDIENIL